MEGIPKWGPQNKLLFYPLSPKYFTTYSFIRVNFRSEPEGNL
jgi:hypothetical protein